MTDRNPITGKVGDYRNPLPHRYRTYGELVTELRARLGYVQQGPSANNNKSILDSFLQEAHEVVYEQLEPTPMRKKTAIVLENGSYLYDWHNDEDDEDIDPGKVISVWVLDDGDNRFKLTQGISERMREDDQRGMPLRYDNLDGQIELYPIPDEEPYRLLIEYIANRPRFVQDTDRPGVPDRLVFLFALYMAQAHYRMPEYQTTLQLFQSMMAKEKAKQHENRRYFISEPLNRKGYVIRSGDKFYYTES
jgi:hypothetical protein